MHTSEAEALDWVKRRFAELPVAGLLSAEPIRCDPAHGRITVTFQARREFTNLMGSVQGGMLTAMLDLAMSFAVLCSLEDGHVVPSLEVKTSFIAPAHPGEIVGDGMLVRKGRSIAFMEGRLTDRDGNLLATASATGQIRLAQGKIEVEAMEEGHEDEVVAQLVAAATLSVFRRRVTLDDPQAIVAAFHDQVVVHVGEGARVAEPVRGVQGHALDQEHGVKPSAPLEQRRPGPGDLPAVLVVAIVCGHPDDVVQNAVLRGEPGECRVVGSVAVESLGRQAVLRRGERQRVRYRISTAVSSSRFATTRGMCLRSAKRRRAEWAGWNWRG